MANAQAALLVALVELGQYVLEHKAHIRFTDDPRVDNWGWNNAMDEATECLRTVLVLGGLVDLSDGDKQPGKKKKANM
jgi:hypothetical protein